MTREQVEALLAKLLRWDLIGDHEDDHSMVPCELDGEFVRFDEVREMLEEMIDAPQTAV